MISKKLASIIFGEEVIKIVDDVTKESDLSTNYVKLYFDGYSIKINIHELAHKCKEWASEKSSYLLSGFNSETAWVGLFDMERLGYEDIDSTPEETFCEDTEPEAIFKACQWILDNENKESK